MAAFDYASLRANVAEPLIRDFGKPVTLIEPGTPGGTPSDPIPGTPIETTAQAVQTEFDLKDRDGTLVQQDDVMFLVSTEGAPPDPELVDTLRADGVTYQVIRVMPLRPGPLTMLWKVHCRK